MSRIIQTLQSYYYRQPAVKVLNPDTATIGGAGLPAAALAWGAGNGIEWGAGNTMTWGS